MAAKELGITVARAQMVAEMVAGDLIQASRHALLNMHGYDAAIEQAGQ